jgi:hypothetical protein
MKDTVKRPPLTPAEEEAIRERMKFAVITEAWLRSAETAIKCARKRWREFPEFAFEQIADARRYLDEAERRIRSQSDGGVRGSNT